MSVFVDAAGPIMKRYDVDDIYRETAVPHERIIPLVASLRDSGILRDRVPGKLLFCLANRVSESPSGVFRPRTIRGEKMLRNSLAISSSTNLSR
jgi:hypothetical protein